MKLRLDIEVGFLAPSSKSWCSWLAPGRSFWEIYVIRLSSRDFTVTNQEELGSHCFGGVTLG